MGYWKSNEDGSSFAIDSELIWGDAPADIMDDAIEKIIESFKKDLGRLPTLEELKSGLLFSADTILSESQAEWDRAQSDMKELSSDEGLMSQFD